VSTALRPLLGLGDYETTRSAWDVYLFYEPGVEWVHRVPPTPTQWAHQLEPDPGVGDRLALGTVSRWLTGRPYLPIGVPGVSAGIGWVAVRSCRRLGAEVALYEHGTRREPPGAA
jgi:hypothetical protein